MTLTLLGNYAQTGHFGGPLAYTPFNVVDASRRSRARRPALRLSPPQASLRRQVHAGRRPLRADLLRAVDDHGRSARTGSTRPPAIAATTSRPRSRCCRSTRSASGAAPARSKTLLQDTASPTIRCSRRPRGAASTRCPATSNRPTSSNDVNGGPSGVGLATAAGKAAFWDMVGAPIDSPEDHRVRRRVRAVRRPRAGAEDAGDGAEGRQAAPRHVLRQQRRHRRLAHRRRHRQQVRRRLRAASSSGRRTAGTS